MIGVSKYYSEDTPIEDRGERALFVTHNKDFTEFFVAEEFWGGDSTCYRALATGAPSSFTTEEDAKKWVEENKGGFRKEGNLTYVVTAIHSDKFEAGNDKEAIYGGPNREYAFSLKPDEYWNSVEIKVFAEVPDQSPPSMLLYRYGMKFGEEDWTRFFTLEDQLKDTLHELEVKKTEIESQMKTLNSFK